jgi:hypothetical protein
MIRPQQLSELLTRGGVIAKSLLEQVGAAVGS